MPVKKVTRKGKVGYRYGDSGKIYFGKDAKAKAEMQGVAIRYSEARQKKNKK